MSEARIRRHMEHLAGELPHRGSNTDAERAAAEYIRDRFKEATPDAGIDDFYAVTIVQDLLKYRSAIACPIG